MAKKETNNNSKYEHKKLDDSLNIVNNTIVKKTKTANSQRKAIKQYEQKFEQVKIRLPIGSRDKIKKYVTESNKYTSVNSMFKSLVENEIGETLD